MSPSAADDFSPTAFPSDVEPARSDEPADDPGLVSGRREALVVLMIWAGALAYTIGYCYLFGYRFPDGTGRTLSDLTFVCGFPDWVFWGIVVPWGVCFLLSTWFCFRFMTDDDLEEEADAELFDGLADDKVPHA